MRPIVSPPDPALLDRQSWLRVTEVMPDPEASGADWEYEWVEITNLGTRVASLAGMTLLDRQASTSLPQVNVPPGASIVIAGPRAVVDADIRLDVPIGNGLGN